MILEAGLTYNQLTHSGLDIQRSKLKLDLAKDDII